ncbi:MAG: GNAT family N-acetyltransferase [Caldilineae bacterium]|nr:MAG: GNAT family N-acetyltransferase [Caldilineae bacterium]
MNERVFHIELPAAAAVTVHLSADPAAEAAAAIHEAIKAFNDRVSPYHLAIRRPDAITPLNLLVRDRQGRLLGGLIASTYWQWLDIDDLWLDERIRRQGVGRFLMARAEEEAAARGCRRAQVKTFSFQALDFYRKLGFRVVGELRDYPPGAVLYWLRKDW